MSEPLEVRRRPTSHHLRMLGARVALLVVGLVLLVPGVVALVTQTLTVDARIQACFLVGMGGFAAGLGGLRTAKAWRLASRMVILRLDEVGVQLRGGAIEHPQWSMVAWPDVEAVEVRMVTLDEPWKGPREPMTALRFVPRADDRVGGAHPDPYTHVKASSLGLSPQAAAMTMLQGSTSAFRIPLVLDWVRRHQPQVRVDDLREATG